MAGNASVSKPVFESSGKYFNSVLKFLDTYYKRSLAFSLSPLFMAVETALAVL